MKKKLAVIRDGRIRNCPFGLEIPEACQHAGAAIGRMAPVDIGDTDAKKSQIKKANALVYVYHKNGKRCPFADKILTEYGKVDCDFGDTGQGQKSVPYSGSPLYPQTFSGIGLDGLYGYPLGYYADNNESRNLFFGLFSFLGSEKPKELIKIADKYDDSEEKEKADLIDKILETIENIRDNDEFEDKLNDVEEFLQKYKDQHEANRTDSGMLYELAEKWFGPRQVSR